MQDGELRMIGSRCLDALIIDTVCDLNNGYGQARVKVHSNGAGAVQSVTTITYYLPESRIFFT